jgi:hypothetical protein
MEESRHKTKGQQAAVRNYLISLRHPAAMHDDDAIATLQETIDQTDDPVELHGNGLPCQQAAS